MDFSLIWRRHHNRCSRAAKFRPMLGAQGQSREDLYRATPALTQGLGFSGLILRTAPIQSYLTTHKGMWRIYSNPGESSRVPIQSPLTTRKGTYSYSGPHEFGTYAC
jgi:hypothetical protein